MTEQGVPSMDLDELERLLEAARPGSLWTVDEDRPMTPPVDGATLRLFGDRVPFRSTLDAKLAATAVNSLPALIAAARRAEELEKALEQMVRVFGPLRVTADFPGLQESVDQARATLAEGAPR